MSKGKENQEEDFIVDKIVWKILTPILKPLSYLTDLFFPYTEVRRAPLGILEPCYCGSGLNYQNCHRTADKKKNKMAIKIIKSSRKGEKVKYKLVNIKDPKVKIFKGEMRDSGIDPTMGDF